MPVAIVRLKDARHVKLGRIRPKVLPQVLKFKAYYNPLQDQAPPPAKVDYYTKALPALKRVYLNDQYGDCVIAGKYHQVGVWTANDETQGPSTPIEGTDQEVLQTYHQICGPGDNGCVITDVLNVMKTTGIPLGGVLHKIDGYVAIDWTNKLEVMVALEVFGSLTLGINLPGDWTCTNCTWGITNSEIVGGHDVCAVGYDDQGVQICTWGGLVTITWDAFLSSRWIEECYAELSPDWYGSDKLAPNGIDAATLQADLAKLGGGVIPDPGPGPQPPQPPQPPAPPAPPVPIVLTGTLNLPALDVTTNIPFVHGKTEPVSVPITVSNQQMGFTIPPWVVSLLNLVCSQADQLPPPYNRWAAVVCGLLPTAKTPCRCH